MNEIVPKTEARKRLEESVKNFDWIAHFLGSRSNQDDFLEVYRGLHAQIREGDKLEIKLSPRMHEGRHGLEVPTATFEILLIKQDGKGEIIYTRNTTGGMGYEHLLYQD